jgi:hypothetical protein
MGGAGRASRIEKPLSNAAILLQKTSHGAPNAVIWITLTSSCESPGFLAMDNWRKREQDSVSGSVSPGTRVLIDRTRIHAEPEAGGRVFRRVIQITSGCAAGHRIPMRSLSQYGRIDRRFLWQP